MTRLYLVRHAVHGLVDKVLAGRLTGVHLSQEGQAQALGLARYFADRPVGAILSSPLERCRETATPIAERLTLSVATEPALNELDCGAWTGESFATLQDDPRWHAWNNERDRAAIPGGESMRDAQGRVMALVNRFGAVDGQATMLLTHSDIVKVVVATLLGSPLEWHDRLQIDPASITTLDLWPGGGKVVRMNETVPPA